jgi:hypothetical protein
VGQLPDFDAPGAYTTFCARFPDLAQTFTVATGGGGWHVYLRVEALPRRGADRRQVREGSRWSPKSSPHT